ncbi:MAG TPA: hypothetical protein VHD81_01730 [Mycobacteriales bacterium]|nr:hypothetical protein [Mycobacteriales bacterium]
MTIVGVSRRSLGWAIGAALVGVVSGCSSSGSSGTTAQPAVSETAAVSTSPSSEYSPHPCQVPGYSGAVFAHSVQGAAPHAALVVQRVTVTCGVPDDVSYDPTGQSYTAQLAPSVRIHLDLQGANGPKLQQVTLSRLARLLDDKTDDPQFGGYYTGVFGINKNTAGQITELDELFHP